MKKDRSFLKRLLAYIYMPVFFCIICYLVLWAGLRPFWQMGSAYASFVMADDTPVFNAKLTSSYDPGAAAETRQQIESTLSSPASGEVAEGFSRDAYVVQEDGSVVLQEKEVPAYTDDLKSFAEHLREASAAAPASTSAAVEPTVPSTTSGAAEPKVSASTSVAVEPTVPANAKPGDVIYSEPYKLITDIEFPVDGDHYAQITCERIGLDGPVYWNDTEEILKEGVGQSLLSRPPGFGRLILMSAHNTTYFKCLENIAAGDVIYIDTNYDRYEYVVSGVEVLNEKVLEDVIADKMLEEKEELVIYTCYPFYVISGRKTDRLVVTAQRVSGINIKWRGVD